MVCDAFSLHRQSVVNPYIHRTIDEVIDPNMVIREHPASVPMTNECLLLNLAPEIRIHIFNYVLNDVRCRRPLVVWDNVCIGIGGRRPARDIAILLTCRTTYEDSVSLLYDDATVEMSIRNDSHQENFPRFTVNLGAIGLCSTLRRLRHVQLEIAYRANSPEAVLRVISRIKVLASVFKEAQKLRSLTLIFFDEGKRVTPKPGTEAPGDRILRACMDFESQILVGVSRNQAAKWSMSEAKWEALQRTAGGTRNVREAYQETNFDYWEVAFRQKN